MLVLFISISLNGVLVSVIIFDAKCTSSIIKHLYVVLKITPLMITWTSLNHYFLYTINYYLLITECHSYFFHSQCNYYSSTNSGLYVKTLNSIGAMKL